MKKFYLAIAALLMSVAFPLHIGAQYTSIVNQAANILQTAVVGGFRYKGFVDASYTGGVGNLKANFGGVSTIHGFQYADWFFMGAGLGVDVVFSETDTRTDDYMNGKITRTCGVMVPIFTDFRFNIGSQSGTSMFIDLKAGGSFLIGGDYLAIENGYISNSEYFLLKPSIGIRIPVSSMSPKRAFNIGVTYQLLTCNYWYNGYDSNTLSSVGATVSYEW